MNQIDYQQVFQHLPGLFLVLAPDAGFTILGASDAYLASTRNEREAIIGRGIFEVFSRSAESDMPGHETLGNLKRSLARVMASRTPDEMPVQHYDISLPASEGGGVEERHWLPVNKPVLSHDGEITCIIHRVEDVTAQVLAERLEADKLAREQSLRAMEIVESITEGFFALDREWRFAYVNHEAERILGRDRNALVGNNIWSEYPGLHDSVFEPIYRNAMDRKQPGMITAYYPDHECWYEVRTYPSPTGISAYFRNVTERKLAEAERDRLIQESEHQRRIYEASLSNTPDFIYVFDLNHCFTYANEALITMFGRTREETFGKTFIELGYEPWHAEMHCREIDQVVATRQPIRGEVPFNGTHGRRIYDYIFVPVIGANDEVVAVAGTTRDITDRQRAEQAIREQAERLEESDRAKDEFLATLSHELRNPLAPLRNSLAILRMPRKSAGKDNESDGEVMRIHEMMERQVDHMVHLVDDLLEVSRITKGTFALRHEPVELSTIVRNAVETSEPLIQTARHTLTVSLPGETVMLQGDPVRLSQIVANLLNNAAKYTDDGGEITVSARRCGDDAVISVRDNGTGIEPEALPRMFGMFVRGDRTSGRGQGGLGIGLALARRLAQMHGGTLTATSGGSGKGSEFTFTLPLAESQHATLPSADNTQLTLSRQRILVVDDNRDAADSLGMLLTLMGADVRIADDGPAALKIFREHDPAVVLLDIGMPGMDGYEVARRLRAEYSDRRPTLIAMTGWGQDKDRQTAREAGFDHHLVKPADLNALQALLVPLAAE